VADLHAPPGFMFYPESFFGDENVIALEQLQDPDRHIAVAAYCRLIFRSWRQERPGYLPDDDEKLARLSGLGDRWPDYRRHLAPCFAVKDGWWVQKRLVRERVAQLERSARLAEAGKHGGRKSQQERKKSSHAKPAQAALPSQVKLSVSNSGSVSREPESTPSRAEILTPARVADPVPVGSAGSRSQGVTPGAPIRLGAILPSVLPGNGAAPEPDLTPEQVRAELDAGKAEPDPSGFTPDVLAGMEAERQRQLTLIQDARDRGEL